MDEILIASRNTIYMLDRLIYYIRNDIGDEKKQSRVTIQANSSR